MEVIVDFLVFPLSSCSLYCRQVKYGGVEFDKEQHSIELRDGMRYDSFAHENIPVKVTTIVNPEWKPEQMTIIETMYHNTVQNEDKPISMFLSPNLAKRISFSYDCSRP